MGLLVEHAKLETRLADPDPALRRLLARVGPPQLPALLSLARARVQVRTPEQLPALEALASRLEVIATAKPPLSAKELALTGGDIMKTLGVGPSPKVGEATRYLVETVLDDPSLNTADALRDRLSAWAVRGA